MKNELARSIQQISQLSGEFQLRSGEVSTTYFDKYRFEAQPELLAQICAAVKPLIPGNTTVLAGLEMGGIPLATVLSQQTGIATAFIRKEAKTYGTCRYAEGAPLPAAGVTIIEDVISSGGAILEALNKLRADGINPAAAVCVIDRETGGRDPMTEHEQWTWDDDDAPEQPSVIDRDDDLLGAKRRIA